MINRTTALVLAGAVLGGTVATVFVGRVQAQRDPAIPYQGQNTGRFQMFFGPMTRKDSYLLDTTNGRVWAIAEAPNKNAEFRKVIIRDRGASGPVGRYKIFFGAYSRADTFLVDTEQGDIWQLVQDTETERIGFVPRKVEDLGR